VTGLITFLLLLVPTLLMGSTLPLLAAHFVRQTGNVGESVGSLYAINTLGSSIACFAAAVLVMHSLGESGAVRLAAVLNALAGTAALLLAARSNAVSFRVRSRGPASAGRKTIPFGCAVFLAAAVGFLSLAYEIVFYRY